MKGKNLLAGLLMAFLGAVIALVVYTQLVGTPVPASRETSGVDSGKAQAYLTSLQQRPGQIDFTYAAEQTVHAVVHVTTKTMMGAQASNPIMEFFYGREYQQQQRPREVRGYGSGVIISNDGYIITNNHVIEDAQNVEIALNDRRTFNAEVVGRDPSTDLALLKVKAENLPFIRYGDSDKLRVGEWVLAVGNPFNLTSTVTAGIVSAKGRSLGLNGGDYQIESFIQTDAALNMGNSGGALVDANGNLVGITSAIYSPSGAYSGNSFAIPVTIVSKVIGDLKEFGTVQRALIGVNIRDVTYQDAEEHKLAAVRGILVTNVIESGAAAAAGMKENDVIIEFDGVPVNSVGELQEQVGRHRPGDKATVICYYIIKQYLCGNFLGGRMRQLKITKSITNRESASLDKYLQEIGKEELISVEEEVELAQRIKKGDRAALEKLTKANLRFVVSVAKQYQNQGLASRFINEGNLGLIKAAEKFDETSGFKFISYAVWWIRQSILQALAEQSRIVRLPLTR
jgi:serine protease Do